MKNETREQKEVVGDWNANQFISLQARLLNLIGNRKEQRAGQIKVLGPGPIAPTSDSTYCTRSP